MALPSEKSTDLSKLKSPQKVSKQPESAGSESREENHATKNSGVAEAHGTSEIEMKSIYKKSESPMILPKEVLDEAAKGVVGQPEENENFHPVFYQNLVATRQHDSTLRPLPDSPTPSKAVKFEGVLEHRVRARRVCPSGKDELEKVVVTQLEYCGSGVFSDVYKGFVVNVDDEKPQKQPCAIKKLWPDPSKEDRQIGLLRKFQHENLVKMLYYYVCVHPKSKASMWTILMELMPSTVALEQSKYIMRGRIMPVMYSKLWMYQTLAGLAYLEMNKFMHLDIKPDNLLVDKDTGRLKIGDFGSTKEYSKDTEQNWYQVTRYYRAPELCFKFTKFDPTVDVWAAGCILVEMLTNRIIFFGTDNDDQLAKIFRILGTPTVEQLAQCIPSHNVDSNILKKKYPPADWHRILLRYNQQINTSCTDLIASILRYECNKRLRGVDALKHRFFDTIKDPRAKLPNGCPVPELWSGSS